MMELTNISGESREYRDGSIIYEFPVPPTPPTKVPDEVGKRLLETGLFKCNETVVAFKKVTDSENDDYRQELIDLPNIAEKTADDIIMLYPTKKDLIEGVKNNKLPFDEDVVETLKESYGGFKNDI